MLSNSRIKLITSLQKKKYRIKEQLFVVEGDKLVREFLVSGYEVATLVAKPEWLASLATKEKAGAGEIVAVSYDELKRVSTLTSPHNALALVRLPVTAFVASSLPGKLGLALDSVQDPGNMGTIIRVAAWFNIPDIYCSDSSVDAFNPKVIQATMGAIMHVRVHYLSLPDLFREAAAMNVPLFGTSLEGENIYEADLPDEGIILLGNESRGVSDELASFVDRKLMIPYFGKRGEGIDSLNVGMAAAITCSEFRRRIR